MAKSKKQDVALPEGFTETSLNGPQNWVKMEEGLIITGELLSRHERRSDPGNFFYCVKLTQPCKATRGAGEEKEEIMVEVGENVCFDERAGLRDLAALLDTGKIYQVYIACLGKSKMKTAQGEVQAWKFKLGHKVIGNRGNTNGTVRPMSGKGSQADSDIPF